MDDNKNDRAAARAATSTDIKTWQERIIDEADAGKVLLPLAMAQAEIADLRAVLASQPAPVLPQAATAGLIARLRNPGGVVSWASVRDDMRHAAELLERASLSQPAQAAGDEFKPVGKFLYVGIGYEATSSDDPRGITLYRPAAPVIAAPTATAEPAITDPDAKGDRPPGCDGGGEFSICCSIPCLADRELAEIRVAAAPAPQQAPLTDAIPKLDENEALRKLAFRTLWLAYVWNDHNFKAAHLEARATCEALGIGSFDEANAWIESINNRVSAASSVTATTEQDAARYRWLRNSAKSVDWCRAWLSNGGVAFSYYCRTSPEAMDQEIDRAIDRAAMAATQEKNDE